ncbi:hypothetical protein R1flu_004062 [Riccia fluitans]|uniref:Uncharacterized protein n=1 Tax=Riccia fluitans TaxID=41844 RepID=A0ABD1YP74_9MARC
MVSSLCKLERSKFLICRNVSCGPYMFVLRDAHCQSDIPSSGLRCHYEIRADHAVRSAIHFRVQRGSDMSKTKLG